MKVQLVMLLSQALDHVRLPPLYRTLLQTAAARTT